MTKASRRAQPWLGTLVEVSIADPLADPVDELALQASFDAAFFAIGQVHRRMSFHEPDSDVMRINRATAGEIVEVDSSTWFVIDAALSLSNASEGIFDIACALKLVEWGYLPQPGKGGGTVPSRDMLAMEDGNRIRKLCAGWIDLGGIAKGYAVDVAVEALKWHDIQSACVNAGGDLRVLGASPYEIAIRDPRDPISIAMRVPVNDGALATSGAYFTRKQREEGLCSALIDGRNGVPVTHDFSVSVQAPTCMIADALTKIVAAIGDPYHAVPVRYGATAFII